MVVPTEDDSAKLLAARLLDKLGASFTFVAEIAIGVDVVFVPSLAFTIKL